MEEWEKDFKITRMGQLNEEYVRRGLLFKEVCDDCKKYGKCRHKLSKTELQYFEEREREAEEQQRQAAINREKNKPTFTMDNFAIPNLEPLSI